MAEGLDDDMLQQENELQSLESIYGKELTILTPRNEFMIEIKTDIVCSLQVLLCNQPSLIGQSLTPPLPHPPTLRSTAVSHLPPVTLYVRYRGVSYPTEESPHCHISARWLDPTLADRLKLKLVEMFTPGWPVVFDWVSYISNNLVDDYCDMLNNESGQSSLERDHSPPTGPHPNQIFLRSISQFNDVEEHDKFETHKEFLDSIQECSVCLEEKLGRFFCNPCVDCKGPGVYCKDCVRQYCETLLEEGRVSQVTCPYPSCNKPLSDPLLHQLLDKDTLDKYLGLRQQVHLDSIPGMVYCPRSACSSRIVSDPNSDLAVCDNCGFPFCKVCRQTWHGVVKCPAFERLTEDNSKPSEKKSNTKDDKESRLDELKSMLWFRAREDVKKCPQCSTSIQKTGGCNKMSCWKCGSSFCWLCGQHISGYGHFTLVSCQLFRTPVDSSNDDEPNEEVSKLQLATSEDTLQKLLNSACPRCGKVEHKSTNNNWISCRKCKMRFCHQCNEPCYGRYHFSEYGCREFSTLEQDIALMEEQQES